MTDEPMVVAVRKLDEAIDSALVDALEKLVEAQREKIRRLEVELRLLRERSGERP